MGDRRGPDNFQGVNAAALEATVMRIIRGLGGMVQKYMELDFYRIYVVAQYWLPHFLENTLTESPGIESGSLET